MLQDILKPSELSPAFIRSFTNHFAGHDNWHNLDDKTANLGYGWLHYAFIRVLKPKRVLCIGSKYGFVPAVCALACKHNQRGVVDFVDASYDEFDPKHDGKHWGGVGFWRTLAGQRQFEKWHLNQYLKMYIARTDAFFPKQQTKRWGYIHIDGDHSYKGVRYDFKQSWKLLDESGIIAIHDIATPDTMGNVEYGTRKLWKELVKSHQHTFRMPGICGVGFVQKL